MRRVAGCSLVIRKDRYVPGVMIESGGCLIFFVLVLILASSA